MECLVMFCFVFLNKRAAAEDLKSDQCSSVAKEQVLTPILGGLFSNQNYNTHLLSIQGGKDTGFSLSLWGEKMLGGAILNGQTIGEKGIKHPFPRPRL